MTTDYSDILTPPGDSLNLSPIGRRALALLIDAVIMGLLGAIAGHLIPFLGAAFVWFFYGPVLESSELQATIGKHLMGIQVADLMGRRISLRVSVIRNALKIVSMAVICLGFLFVLFTERRQALHDLLADTVVVYGRSERGIVDAWVAMVREIFGSTAQTLRQQMPESAPFEAGRPASSGGDPHGESRNGAAGGSSAASEASLVDQLERLKKLFHEGALTAEEYEAAKGKLLSR